MHMPSFPLGIRLVTIFQFPVSPSACYEPSELNQSSLVVNSSI